MAVDILYDMTMERDQLELSLGDTLDVKAGILLAITTILGTLTGALLASSSLGKWSQIAQMVSLGFLLLGCVFAVVTLLPRDYLLPNLPKKYREWFGQLQQYYKDTPDEVESQVANGMTQVANERIERNHKINSDKSRYLGCAFWPTLLALAIDIGTLAVLGISKIPS
jgi:hypothetical protein